jgi:hypothetical protein
VCVGGGGAEQSGLRDASQLFPSQRVRPTSPASNPHFKAQRGLRNVESCSVKTPPPSASEASVPPTAREREFSGVKESGRKRLSGGRKREREWVQVTRQQMWL